jgi:hypothetical protein
MFPRALAALAAATVILAFAPARASARPLTAQEGAVSAAACTFSAPTPSKSGSNVTASTTISDCPSSARWTLTIQRHTSGPFWQNLGSNWRDGNGDLATTTGCGGSGWRTYRSILQSNQGHQSVSGHHRFSC